MTVPGETIAITIQLEIGPHEALAQVGIVEVMHVKGKIQCILGDLPEIGMMPHQAAKPGVLQLLDAPLPACQQSDRAVRCKTARGKGGVGIISDPWPVFS